MKRLASACSWVSAATPSSRPIATSNALAGPRAAAGRTVPRYAGSGCELSTESKTILSGTGSRSASGLASSPIPNRAARWSQYGRAWRSSRRYSARSVITPNRAATGRRPPGSWPWQRWFAPGCATRTAGRRALRPPRLPRRDRPPPRERLDQVERGREQPAPQPGHPTVGAVGKSGAERAEPRLRDRRHDGGYQQRHRERERPPGDAQRRDPREARRHEMPFRHLGERTQQTGAGLVERLKRRDAPDAVIDPRATP